MTAAGPQIRPAGTIARIAKGDVFVRLLEYPAVAGQIDQGQEQLLNALVYFTVSSRCSIAMMGAPGRPGSDQSRHGLVRLHHCRCSSRLEGPRRHVGQVA